MNRDERARYYEGLRDGNELLRNEVAATSRRVLELEAENRELRQKLVLTEQGAETLLQIRERRIEELEKRVFELTESNDAQASEIRELTEERDDLGFRVKRAVTWIRGQFCYASPCDEFDPECPSCQAHQAILDLEGV